MLLYFVYYIRNAQKPRDPTSNNVFMEFVGLAAKLD